MTHRVLVEIRTRGTVTVTGPNNPHQAVAEVNTMLAGPEPEECLDAEPEVIEARGIRAYAVNELPGVD